MKIKPLIIAGCLVLFSLTAIGDNPVKLEKQLADKKPFTADDLINMERLSSPTISPDSQYLAYAVRRTDLEVNRGISNLWLMDLKNLNSKPLTDDNDSTSSPVWSKDSQAIYFLSSRNQSSQIWKINFKTGKAKQVTNFELDVTSFKLSPDNQKILFSSRVYPDCNNFNCTKLRDEKLASKKSSGIVYDKLFVRHWDHWIDQKQSQLFVVDIDSDGAVNNQSIIGVSKSINANIPSDPFGGSEEYNFSADSRSVYYSARLADKNEPSSTNFDIYRVALKDSRKAENLTQHNLAWDSQPVLSHNGQYLAYLAMQRAGFEADRFEVILHDLKSGKVKRLTDNWDRSFSSLQFSKDDASLYLTGNHLGTKALWKFDISSGQKTLFNQDGAIIDAAVSDQFVVFAKDNLKNPVQFFKSDLDGNAQKQISFHNQEKLNRIAFGDFEQFSFKGWNNEKVYGYLVKPANFEAGKKYPLAFLIHGGPQGSFGDHFHYRWNPQTYTGQGYVAVMIDFHGSTGYGQAFTDSITQNWGSRPFEDLQKGLDYAIKNYDFIDGDNACALGASYGGYMINWIAGNWPDRFKCLVNHDGVFDNRMMAYATEELWFTEWENGGAYYQTPEKHEQFNPVNYVNNWKTPMLVVQGELDYRIPVTQSLATFTALQKKGIDSKLLYFPDENHWVLKPANSLQWHAEVNQWLNQYLSQ